MSKKWVYLFGEVKQAEQYAEAIHSDVRGLLGGKGANLAENPFATIDRDGVGELMDIAVKKGRSVKPDLEIGICGEHGGDPESIRICHQLGLTYVSCSPFRVPVARLAAAHAALLDHKTLTHT